MLVAEVAAGVDTGSLALIAAAAAMLRRVKSWTCCGCCTICALPLLLQAPITSAARCQRAAQRLLSPVYPATTAMSTVIECDALMDGSMLYECVIHTPDETPSLAMQPSLRPRRPSALHYYLWPRRAPATLSRPFSSKSCLCVLLWL
jgi:hypothetical protein